MESLNIFPNKGKRNVKLCQKTSRSREKTKTNNKEDKDTRGDRKFSLSFLCPWKAKKKNQREKKK